MNNDDTDKKLWSGRFTESTHPLVEEFTASVRYDRRLYAHDIRGSIAHARMLARVGVLTEDERDAIIKGLQDLQLDIERGDFAWSVELEDVHMNIEARLTDRIGEVGKKLHTGRSRNDQIATDMRLYVREQIDELSELLKNLQGALLELAAQEADTLMPGFTHLQTAQPVTFGHHLMAWFEMLQRDRERFLDCRRRVNVLPLGAAALAGTSFPIDRDYSAALLDFDAVAENSLDAVSDRDFAVEFSAAAALCMTHLSRFSEELILWSSAQFNFIELGDAFCTGSSIMPQKKNPDVPELVRGKTGRVYGGLLALLTLLKGQPLAYNKDNQEDKEPLFDAADTLKQSLHIYADMITAIKPNREVMAEAAARGYSTATDLADYLVRKGMAFRDAHEVVGQAVRHCIEQGTVLDKLDLKVLQGFSKAIESDVFEVLSLEGSVRARDHIGGTAPAQVRAAIKRARGRLEGTE